jgi:hypothetical protein
VTQGEIHKICAAVQIKDRDPGFAVFIGMKHPAVGSILVSCFGDDRRGTGFFTPLKGIFDQLVIVFIHKHGKQFKHF